MEDQNKFKVIGAFVVGFAIVAGAYTVRNFGQPTMPPPTPEDALSAAVIEAPARVPIAVVDTNADGIEDWREKFVEIAPIAFTNASTSDYVIPDTLTDQLGIAFFQDIVRSKGYGVLGTPKEEVVSDTVKRLDAYATDKIIDVKDITISNDSSPAAIRLYANAIAEAINNNNNPNLKHELLILREAIDSQDQAKAAELDLLTKVYAGTRDDTMAVPVPPILVKAHLDLINVYQALYSDIDSMSKVLSDPMLSLVRLKRYEEDAEGLAIALQNMFLALEPYAAAFSMEDPAVLFVAFSPNFNN
jgi:hypothetical protein